MTDVPEPPRSGGEMPPPLDEDFDEAQIAEMRVRGETPPVSPFSLHGSLEPPSAPPYLAPLPAAARPGLIARLSRTPSTAASSPFENQATEALAWLVDHSDAFARAFSEALVGDDAEARTMVGRSTSFGAHTQVRLPELPWAKRQVADLSIVDSGRHFQVLVEVKAGAPFGQCDTPDGRRLEQPECYLEAWRAGVLGGQARARRLATISTDGPRASPPPDPMRGPDLLWERDVIPLLKGFSEDPLIGPVAGELATVLGARLRPVRADADPDLGIVRRWADEAIRSAVTGLARNEPHLGLKPCGEDGRTRDLDRFRPNPGRSTIGCYIAIEREGGRVVLWLYVCTAASEANQPGATGPSAALTLWTPRAPEDAARVLGSAASLFSSAPDRGGRRWPRAWSDAALHQRMRSPDASLAAWISRVLQPPAR